MGFERKLPCACDQPVERNALTGSLRAAAMAGTRPESTVSPMLNTTSSRACKGLSTAKLEGRLEGRAEGFEEGHAAGFLEGERKKQKEIARRMKEHGVPMDVIIQSTGLSAEELEE